MICVLMKDDLYVSGVVGTLRVQQTQFGIYKSRLPNTKVKFSLTKDINLAKLIENPSLDAVSKYGLIATIVKVDKPTIESIGNIYEQAG